MTAILNLLGCLRANDEAVTAPILPTKMMSQSSSQFMVDCDSMILKWQIIMKTDSNLNGPEVRIKCIDNDKDYKDIELGYSRHPIIQALEKDLLQAKPSNSLHFIKRWAMKRLHQGEESDEEEQVQSIAIPKHQSKRRMAVVMRQENDSLQWDRLIVRQPVLKNEECKSRIMLGLRSIPFLGKLSWQDIEEIVKWAEVREYYEGDTLIAKGEEVDLMFVPITGQIVRESKPFHVYSQGQPLFAEALIAPCIAKYPYCVSSQKAQVCGMKAYQIHELAKKVNQKQEQMIEHLLMRIPSFACLDSQELYKTLLLVRQTQHKTDDVVIEKGSQVGRVFLVIRGEVAICRVSLEGTVTAFQSFREGTVFGEEWLITTNEAEHTVIARAPTILGSIERRQFEASITRIDLLLLRKKSRAHRYQ